MTVPAICAAQNILFQNSLVLATKKINRNKHLFFENISNFYLWFNNFLNYFKKPKSLSISAKFPISKY